MIRTSRITHPDHYYRVPDSLKNDAGFVLNVAQAHRTFAKDIHERNLPNTWFCRSRKTSSAA
ncbi:hypothetical protein [Sinobaca sp. H24]|uniref:hypothetical protein n=1 Tax=Sinobaca sp. H24 TaxID=2923376 RepID=UPI00207942BF|nr:hypothetical protein [Sinobaca sp. H24]